MSPKNFLILTVTDFFDSLWNRHDFGHACSSFICFSTGMQPTRSYSICTFCLCLPLDLLSGASTQTAFTSFLRAYGVRSVSWASRHLDFFALVTVSHIAKITSAVGALAKIKTYSASSARRYSLVHFAIIQQCCIIAKSRWEISQNH